MVVQKEKNFFEIMQHKKAKEKRNKLTPHKKHISNNGKPEKNQLLHCNFHSLFSPFCAKNNEIYYLHPYTRLFMYLFSHNTWNIKNYDSALWRRHKLIKILLLIKIFPIQKYFASFENGGLMKKKITMARYKKLFILKKFWKYLRWVFL